MIPVSDERVAELLARAGGGDQLAVNELFAQHRERLRLMITVRMDPRLLGRVDPSDVVQDTLIEAMRKLSQFIQDRPIAFYPWLRQLAWNRLIDLYRFHIQGAKRRVDREMHMGTALSDESIASFARYLVAGQPSPSSELVRSELRHRVRAALESLPDKYRESLAMRHLEQLSIREIATIVGAPEGTIKARLFRGLKILQQLLADPTTGVES